MLGKLIAFAISSGLAKKAWDHYQATQAAQASGRTRKNNVSDVTPRPVASGKPAAKPVAAKKPRKAAVTGRRKASARPSA